MQVLGAKDPCVYRQCADPGAETP